MKFDTALPLPPHLWTALMKAKPDDVDAMLDFLLAKVNDYVWNPNVRNKFTTPEVLGGPIYGLQECGDELPMGLGLCSICTQSLCSCQHTISKAIMLSLLTVVVKGWRLKKLGRTATNLMPKLMQSSSIEEFLNEVGVEPFTFALEVEINKRVHHVTLLFSGKIVNETSLLAFLGSVQQFLDTVKFNLPAVKIVGHHLLGNNMWSLSVTFPWEFYSLAKRMYVKNVDANGVPVREGACEEPTFHITLPIFGLNEMKFMHKDIESARAESEERLSVELMFYSVLQLFVELFSAETKDLMDLSPQEREVRTQKLAQKMSVSGAFHQ
eukprot:CAMPEP_0175120140 /NCGR_PEP_ID=MMETSP0087-20121206/455_1 /TAXON_ID=136419 /ORGANISM="Unknown Unknown, Strain D1" /LENGTH=323 /DNA_ID=CAMNT_0016401553 /DNA_START=97 /DNA_END=1068 /DNA_ORIENTATION=-